MLPPVAIDNLGSVVDARVPQPAGVIFILRPERDRVVRMAVFVRRDLLAILEIDDGAEDLGCLEDHLI